MNSASSWDLEERIVELSGQEDFRKYDGDASGNVFWSGSWKVGACVTC